MSSIPVSSKPAVLRVARMAPRSRQMAAIWASATTSPGAIASLTRALEVTEDAALLFNRAAAFGAAERWADAKADLTRARELDPEDPEISAQLRACEERLRCASARS